VSQRRFCIMTFGRTGSTWLIQALAEFPDVAVPAKNVVSRDNELLMKGMAEKYSALIGRPLQSEDQVIDAFFAYNAGSKFAGFKSMPTRHKNYQRFVQRTDIAFLTLERRDIVSTSASFLMARKHGTWRRDGGALEQKLAFLPEDRDWVAQNLGYIVQSKLMLAGIPRALRLDYEDLCQPGFENARLDAFFERPVRLPAPKAATLAQDYLENWDEFRDFVQERWGQALDAVPAQLQKLLSREG